MKIEDHPKPFANDHPYKSQLGIAKLEKELSPATQINRPKLAPNDHADQRQCKITKLEKELETSNKTVKKLNRKLSKLDLRKNLDREMGIMEDYFEYINSDTESQLDHVEKIRQAAFKARKESSINTSEVVLNFEMLRIFASIYDNWMLWDYGTKHKSSMPAQVFRLLQVLYKRVGAVGALQHIWKEVRLHTAKPETSPQGAPDMAITLADLQKISDRLQQSDEAKTSQAQSSCVEHRLDRKDMEESPKVRRKKLPPAPIWIPTTEEFLHSCHDGVVSSCNEAAGGSVLASRS